RRQDRRGGHSGAIGCLGWDLCRTTGTAELPAQGLPKEAALLRRGGLTSTQGSTPRRRQSTHRVKTTLRSIRCTEPHVRNPLRTTPPSTGGPGGCWCRADHVAPGAAARHRLPGDRLLVAGAAVVVAECRRGGVGLRRVRARCPVPGGRPGG